MKISEAWVGLAWAHLNLKMDLDWASFTNPEGYKNRNIGAHCLEKAKIRRRNRPPGESECKGVHVRRQSDNIHIDFVDQSRLLGRRR